MTLEGDWKTVVHANMRLVLFLRQEGISIPSTCELTERFPLAWTGIQQ